jgi:hypothetical protein
MEHSERRNIRKGETLCKEDDSEEDYSKGRNILKDLTVWGQENSREGTF